MFFPQKCLTRRVKSQIPRYGVLFGRKEVLNICYCPVLSKGRGKMWQMWQSIHELISARPCAYFPLTVVCVSNVSFPSKSFTHFLTQIPPRIKKVFLLFINKDGYPHITDVNAVPLGHDECANDVTVMLHVVLKPAEWYSWPWRVCQWCYSHATCSPQTRRMVFLAMTSVPMMLQSCYM